jgi:hypothetical protein
MVVLILLLFVPFHLYIFTFYIHKNDTSKDEVNMNKSEQNKDRKEHSYKSVVVRGRGGNGARGFLVNSSVSMLLNQVVIFIHIFLINTDVQNVIDKI